MANYNQCNTVLHRPVLGTKIPEKRKDCFSFRVGAVWESFREQ